jgi:hypothetical protein
MSFEKWLSQRPKDPKWPLVVAFCIAVPLVAWFAYGIAAGSKTGEVRPALGAVLILTICVPLAVMAFRLLFGPIGQNLPAFVRLFRGNPESYSRGWETPGITEHLDDSFDPDDPFREKKEVPPREFSVGPGLSLFKRYRRPTPKPKRRI